jgi:hypothetical protein
VDVSRARSGGQSPALHHTTEFLEKSEDDNSLYSHPQKELSSRSRRALIEATTSVSAIALPIRHYKIA